MLIANNPLHFQTMIGHRDAEVMHHHCVRLVANSVPLRGDPQTKILVLTISRRQTVIEDSVAEQRAPNHQRRTRNIIDITRIIVAWSIGRLEQADHLRCGVEVDRTTRFLKASIREEKFGANDANARLLVKNLAKGVDRTFRAVGLRLLPPTAPSPRALLSARRS
jgi:hypothetical protein